MICILGNNGVPPSCIHNLRHKQYVSSSFKNKTNISSLPPTEAAAREHSLRVYYQVQQWLSGQATPNEQQKDPSEWGWKKTSSGLVPVPTTLDPAPNSILRYISCKCKKGCHRNCGCRKVGLHCSPICTLCEGLCNNVEPPEDSSDIDVEETEERERGERLPTLTMEQSDPEPGPDAIEEPQYDAEKQTEPGLIVIEEPQPGPSKRQRLI